jgi:hypothetical protein
MDAPRAIHELHVPIASRTLRRIGNPGSCDNRFVQPEASQIIDLVTIDHPGISIDMRRICGRVPMRRRHKLDPSDPHRIVHMVELINILASCG